MLVQAEKKSHGVYWTFMLQFFFTCDFVFFLTQICIGILVEKAGFHICILYCVDPDPGPNLFPFGSWSRGETKKTSKNKKIISLKLFL